MDSSNLAGNPNVNALLAVKNKRVRILARTHCKESSALFDHAAHRLAKTEWSVAEWQLLLNALDQSELTVGEWLSAPFDCGPCLASAA